MQTAAQEIASIVFPILRCLSEGNVSSGNQFAGGMVGEASGGTAIDTCVNMGKISAAVKYAAGIVSLTRVNSPITNCFNYGNINATASGGICSILRTSIDKCYCGNNVKINNMLVETSNLYADGGTVTKDNAAIAWQSLTPGVITNVGLVPPLD